MGIGDIIVYAIAAVALVALAFILLGNWRVGAGGILAYVYINDRNMMQQCSIAHERRAKAMSAPDDYFGRKMREDASVEAKSCAEFAARKQSQNAEALR